jgi:hypothetical protein
MGMWRGASRAAEAGPGRGGLPLPLLGAGGDMACDEVVPPDCDPRTCLRNWIRHWVVANVNAVYVPMVPSVNTPNAGPKLYVRMPPTCTHPGRCFTSTGVMLEDSTSDEFVEVSARRCELGGAHSYISCVIHNTARERKESKS